MVTTETKSSTTTQSLQARSQNTNATFFEKGGKDNALAKDGKDSHFFDNNFAVSKKQQPFFDRSFVQTKLTIGQPGDKYEQEADAMADQVVQRMAENEHPSTLAPLHQNIKPKPIFESETGSPEEESIQTKCEDCENEEKVQKMDMGEEEMPVQAKPESQSSTSDLEPTLNSTKGGGGPLPDKARIQMEGTFGVDFSGVRIHTDSTAVQMNKRLGAQAFTHGNDVYFNAGKYDPNSSDGQKLLGHELTHTVQQNGNYKGIQRQAAAPPTSSTPNICGPNVAGEVANVWSSIQSDFRGWSTDDKMAASLYLISPYVPEAGTNPRSESGSALFGGSWAEPFIALLERFMDDPILSTYVNLTNTRWQLNRDAFDTIGLFVLSADWTLRVPGCGTPSCTGLSNDDLPRGHSDPCESPDLCSFSVQMGTNCWLSGTVNYGTYGIMMKEAYNWCHSQRTRMLALLPGILLRSLGDLNVALELLRQTMSNKEIGAAFMQELFSELSVVGFVGGYKLWDMENPVDPLKWALATYRNGPSAIPSGSNRPNCDPTCGSLDTSIFSDWDYAWEPVKQR